jgi:hypothetical protein
MQEQCDLFKKTEDSEGKPIPVYNPEKLCKDIEDILESYKQKKINFDENSLDKEILLKILIRCRDESPLHRTIGLNEPSHIQRHYIGAKILGYIVITYGKALLTNVYSDLPHFKITDYGCFKIEQLEAI